MPDISIDIGGRSFAIACEPGEESQARAAAELLNAQATTLQAALGRVPESRMLLMAGLMLADRTASVEDQLRVLKARVEELENKPAPEPQRIEVPVIPPQVSETLAEIAARAEALADKVSERIKS